MEIQPVEVTNFSEINTTLNDIISELQSQITYLNNIEIWLNIIVWSVFFVGACWIANWLWKTWFRGIIRSYFKFHI